MPSLFRFLVVLVVIGVLGYAILYALATYVQPVPRQMVVPVPLTKAE